VGSVGSLAEATEEMDEARGNLLIKGYHVNMQGTCHAQYRDWLTGDCDNGLYWCINWERRRGT
jgi:hypothetical protein